MGARRQPGGGAGSSSLPRRVLWVMCCTRASSLSLAENLRVSPQGNRVAFVEHPYGESVESLAHHGPGHIVVIDRDAGSWCRARVDLHRRPVLEYRWQGGLVHGLEDSSHHRFTHYLWRAASGWRRRDGVKQIYLHDISARWAGASSQGRGIFQARGRIALDDAERDTLGWTARWGSAFLRRSFFHLQRGARWRRPRQESVLRAPMARRQSGLGTAPLWNFEEMGGRCRELLLGWRGRMELRVG